MVFILKDFTTYQKNQRSGIENDDVENRSMATELLRWGFAFQNEKFTPIQEIREDFGWWKRQGEGWEHSRIC